MSTLRSSSPPSAAAPLPLGATALRARPSRPTGLSSSAREMMGRLPASMLRQTATDFPHVIEQLAQDWAHPHRMHATLEALMYDRRGGRQGFPFEVLTELAELRVRYERWVGPATHGHGR